ncbi:MAG: hypothetical protein AAGF10_04400 [Verrucomicrobiota bacterium]
MAPLTAADMCQPSSLMSSVGAIQQQQNKFDAEMAAHREAGNRTYNDSAPWPSRHGLQ